MRQFAAMLDHPRAAWLTPYTVDDFRRMRTFLSHGDRVGGAIRTADDGVKEAVSIFNAGGPPGAGGRMLDHLVREGATRLDCIGDDLRRIYERHGFSVVEAIPWNDRFAPEAWNYEVDLRPTIT